MGSASFICSAGMYERKNMSNNAWVVTKKKLKPELVSQLLNDLNISHFKNGLRFEYENNQWVLEYVSHLNGKKYSSGQTCWLKSKNKFMMSHRSRIGGDFSWWIDFVLTNEVAIKFDGLIHDDAVEETWKGEEGKYATFSEFLKFMYTDHIIQFPFLLTIPPEHKE